MNVERNDDAFRRTRAIHKERAKLVNSFIEVFRMTEIPTDVRAKIIIKLGHLINDKYGSNLTEPLVYELVKQLDPNNKILNEKHYLRHIGEP